MHVCLTEMHKLSLLLLHFEVDDMDFLYLRTLISVIHIYIFFCKRKQLHVEIKLIIFLKFLYSACDF